MEILGDSLNVYQLIGKRGQKHRTVLSGWSKSLFMDTALSTKTTSIHLSLHWLNFSSFPDLPLHLASIQWDSITLQITATQRKTPQVQKTGLELLPLGCRALSHAVVTFHTSDICIWKDMFF